MTTSHATNCRASYSASSYTSRLINHLCGVYTGFKLGLN